ncbi:NAD(P)-binding protein [Neohortaea acidophila]|uniref:NAD(P)-binding protein n=1 Tax=Neohortaea acidophila TaxID=245834 RepID=A0A6A6Q0Q4_9PEZI|nr:NAD(P)-binding protein [Neohortaea acidophila]KAF2485559.1 NAD(P)-binding protein [Neohortaea acidophila]
MGRKIFLTGATGYIGGSVFDTIVTHHPEYEVTVLLRNVPQDFSSRYPKVKIIKGDYDSHDILAAATSNADVVVHNGNSDHEPSLKAIISGLLTRQTPGFLLHLSGSGILSDFRSDTYLGKLNPKIWSDVDDRDAISRLPDDALHRNTEMLLGKTVAEHGDKINIAIMCPPDIYGKGKGPGKTWSAFVPMYVDSVPKVNNRIFYYRDGANTRSWVHIDDLMTLYLHVVEAAVAGGGNAQWNREGYYFAGTQEHSHIDVVSAIGKHLSAQGVIENGAPVAVDIKAIDSTVNVPWLPGLARYLWASNSRTRADRARKLFGYQGKAPGLLEVLEADVAHAISKT